MGNLLANAGVMEAAVAQMPEGVQDGWRERLEEIDKQLQQHISEIHMFGEAYDEEDSDTI